jgi:quercetin dioxygenase-like cupin family protein
MEIAVDTRTLWFDDSLGRIAISRADGDGLISAIEVTAPRGSMPPLHVHDEDEGFYVVDGRVTLYAGDAVHELEVAESALAPRDVPHTFRVESDTATLMVMSASGRFEDFVRAAGRPAAAPTLPPPAAPPSDDEVARLLALAAEHGIEIVGPPGMLPSAL